MKKIICLFVITLLLLVCACADKKSEGKTEHELSVLDKSPHELSRQQITKITLPDKDFNNLIGMDKNYYYFENNNNKEWEYLRVKRNNMHEILTYPSLSKKMDINLQYGYKGNLYIGTTEWSVPKDDSFTGDYDQLASPSEYRIMELNPEGEKKEIFSCKSMGFPSTIPFGKNIAVEINDGESINLTILDIETGKRKSIFQSSYKRNQNGEFNGTIVMGLDYSHPSPLSDGFCYQTCSLDNERFDIAKAGTNYFFYYDLGTNSMKKLGSYYRPVEFIGGMENAYIVSDYPVDETKYFVKMYIFDVKTGEYRPFVFDEEDLQYGIIGSGVLDESRFLAYNQYGYYIIDIENKTYQYLDYIKEDMKNTETELDSSDEENEITGFAYMEGSFVFAISDGNDTFLYEITAN